MYKQKTLAALRILLPVAAVCLEMLPWGVVLRFGIMTEDGSMHYQRELYSFFSLMPFGNAIFGPLIAAILSCCVLGLVLLAFLRKKSVSPVAKWLCAMAAVLAVSPLMLGFQYASIVGCLIILILTAETFLLHWTSLRR